MATKKKTNTRDAPVVDYAPRTNDAVYFAKAIGEILTLPETDRTRLQVYLRKLIEVIEQSGGGTEVIANPTLAGTEDALTGLQVGETKYKVGGSLYLHCINVQARNTNASVFTYSPIHLNIYSPKESPYTYEEFKTWLKFNSYVDLNASGDVFYDENSTKYMVVTSIAPSTTTEGVFTAHGRFAVDANNNLTVLSQSAWTSQTMRSQGYSDIVIQII